MVCDAMRKWSGSIFALLRQGLPALAVYALVLQAFLTGAAPASPFAPDAVLCSEINAGAPGPQPAQHKHECLCLSHCAQSHAPAGPAPQAFGLPARVARLADAPTRASDSVAVASHWRPPGARAPPLA